MSSAPLLEIRGLNAWYGESHVLHGVDLDIREGEFDEAQVKAWVKQASKLPGERM